MITCSLEQLPSSKNERLRAWLGQEEAGILAAVVSAQVKHYQIKALNDALSATEGNLKIDSCNANLRLAQRWVNCADVLMELMSRREPFEIAKLT